MSENRKKMSNRNFMLIVLPIVILLVAVCIIATVVMNSFSYLMDMQFGRGERHVVAAEGTENWDTDYYEVKYETPEEAKEASLKVNQKITDEGMILLKNNGVLPLAKGAKVTPFGKGYKFPHYDSPNGTASMKHSFSYAVTPEQALISSGFDIVTCAADLQPETTSTNKKVGDSQNDGSDYNNYPDQPQPAEGTMAINRNSFGSNSRIPELGEYRYDELTDADKAEMAPTTALVFISRTGSEGGDRKFDAYDDGTPHYLSLTQNEKGMIKRAKEYCSKVVVLVNSTNPFELAPVMEGELEADAILWVGNPGENGFYSMGKILCGDVNPSGRTYDIQVRDIKKGPEMANFGSFRYEIDGKPTRYYYVEYVEGMYMGYRYYETAHDIKASGFTYGELDGKGGVKTAGAVTYPFGYGLSYATFEQKIESYSSSGDDITVKVNVKNTSDVAGKEVVQIYYNPPYTDFDKTNKVEKPTATLAAFTKTDIIEPGDDVTVELKFSKEEMSSYCYTRQNPDDSEGCYMLEAGDYEISLRKNSHEIIDTRTWTNNETIWYDNTNPRQLEKDMQSAMDENGNLLDYPAKKAIDPEAEFIAATNLFGYMSDYMERETTPLTRSNWDATVPVDTRESGNVGTPGTTKVPTDETIAMFWNDRNYDALEHYDTVTGTCPGAVEGSPVYVSDSEMPVGNQDNGLTVMDMRGKDYYDENWDLLLNQINWEGEKEAIEEIVTNSNYYTKELASIGLPRVIACEGANGVRVGLPEEMQKITVTWTMCPSVAATFNVDLAREQGEALAAEALANGITARMSPAFNIHRSPFTGRNLEYYSEDPLLTGKIVTGILNGSTSGGMIEHIKHFGLNDQETNRSWGLYTWATEQVAREIYNKPFEIVIREARKTVKYTADKEGNTATRVMRGANAMMVAQNMLGPTTAFANYDLNTRLVRDEWGFTGTLITDWFSVSGSWAEGVLLSGCDTIMQGNTAGAGKDMPHYDTATIRTALRETIHRIAYNIANSNALQNAPPGTIIYYDISPWKIWLIVLNVVVYVIAAAGIVCVVLRLVDESKHPNKYYNAKRDG